MKTICKQCQTECFDENATSFSKNETICTKCKEEAVHGLRLYKDDGADFLSLSTVEIFGIENGGCVEASYVEDTNPSEAEFDDIHILTLPKSEVSAKTTEVGILDCVPPESLFDLVSDDAKLSVNDKPTRAFVPVAGDFPKESPKPHQTVTTQTAPPPEAENKTLPQEATTTDSQHNLLLPSPERKDLRLGQGLVTVSPKYLAACVVVLISFIVLCSRVTSPTAQAVNAGGEVKNERAAQDEAHAVELASVEVPSRENLDAGLIPTPEVIPEATPAPTPVQAAPVIEPTPEAQPIQEPTPPQIVTPNAGRFTIQVGSYNSATEANQRVADLELKGFEGRVVEVEIPKRGTWYRVQVGGFGNRNEATRFGTQLRAQNAAENIIITEK